MLEKLGIDLDEATAADLPPAPDEQVAEPDEPAADAAPEEAEQPDNADPAAND